MFESRVLREVLGSKRDEMTGEWKLQNEGFMIFSPYQILLR